MKRIIPLLLIAALFLLMDRYVFEVMLVLVPQAATGWTNLLFWGFNALAIAAFFAYHLLPNTKRQPGWRQVVLSTLLITYFAKFVVLLFLVADDVRRLFTWSSEQLLAWWSASSNDTSTGYPRSDLLVKTGLITAAIPTGAMTYGIAIGAHNYRLVRQQIFIPDLPAEMEGLTIGQLSDIHAGSLHRRKAVAKGVDLLMEAAPDIICFTGDLVNSRAVEIDHTFDIFEQLHAPLGVYAILGNHDYGHYARWNSSREQEQNLELLKKTHEWLGWDLLLNENRSIHFGEHTLALAGVENWGASPRMPKYGDLDKALVGTTDASVRILLSHDPSHWHARVLPHPMPVHLTLSGHTHGMQFGVHTKRLKWSPIQYHIKHWAGLYQEDDQHLYVNRGFGFHGFPGRIGMPPELTILSLTGTPTHGGQRQ